jgi:hypothetical protein
MVAHFYPKSAFSVFNVYMILFGCHDVGPANYLAELISQNSNPSLCLSSIINRLIFEKTQTRLIDDLCLYTLNTFNSRRF